MYLYIPFRLDECSRTTCHNGGKCHMNRGKAVCDCHERYEGDRCEIGKKFTEEIYNKVVRSLKIC